ncbi:MAG: hypothetical protein ACPLY9_04555 [Nitrososphaerales archaeon]
MARMSKSSDLALLLLLMRSSNDRIEGRTRLQKTVCILKYKHKIPFSFEFRRYFYGPYSRRLQDAVNTLRAAGLITEKEVVLPEGYIKYNYELTEEGKILAKKILDRFDSPDILGLFRDVLESLSEISTDDLVLLAKSVTPAYRETFCSQTY